MPPIVSCRLSSLHAAYRHHDAWPHVQILPRTGTPLVRSRRSVVVPAEDRARLERLCRYGLRPPIAEERIRLTADGDVLLESRHRWSDGTTHLRFHPVELLERLASLTPRPRIHLVLYFGVLAAHAAWRARLPRPGDAVVATVRPPGAEAVAASPAEGDTSQDTSAVAATPAPPSQPRSSWLWAQLMARSSRRRQGFGGPRRSASRGGGSGTTCWRARGAAGDST
jgi:hypothetical protein